MAFFFPGKGGWDKLIIGVNLAFIKANFNQRISSSMSNARRPSIVLLSGDLCLEIIINKGTISLSTSY